VTSVDARAIRPGTEYYLRDDNFVAVMTFADGSIGNLTYTALGSADHPKELLDIYSDGRVLQIMDFKEFKATGCKAERVTRSDKGHAAELAAFHRAVLGETAWPIPLWQQTQAMRIAFDVEAQLAGGASPAQASRQELHG
jgi:predicted dehydrogenase